MKILIAEDDFVSRRFLQKFLSNYGEVDVTVDGMETIEAFNMALEEGALYDLVCLDIMMPEVDGLRVLKTIRKLESERAVPMEKCTKIIMTTALNSVEKVEAAFEYGSEGYAVKPIDLDKFISVMKKMALI